ncbi:MAG TPA: SH3 domain-containing protein [Caldilineales bacterium]|nr:SH3 domain-containing protein [Caldilineales bacterium]
MRKYMLTAALMALLLVILAGCGTSKQPTQVAQKPIPTLHPTFTPTATKDIGAPAPTMPPTPTGQPTAAPSDTPSPEATQPPQEQPSATPPPPTPTPTPAAPQVVVTAPVVNLRAGPGTNYPRMGQAKQGQTFDIVAKNPKGNWFQIEVNGKTVWIINDARWTKPQGDVNAVAVAENIPTPPPPPTPRPTKPPAPTPTPAPTYLFTKMIMEPRINTNSIVTFFGGLFNQRGDGAVSGYKMVVIAPNGERREAPFGDVFLRGDPGLPGEFIYNAKIEFPLLAGTYKVFVADGSGKQVSEAWDATVSGDTRTFLPRWRQK